MKKLWNIDDYKPDRRGAQIAEALEYLDLPDDFSLLDVACGYGNVLQDVAVNFTDCNPLGIDIEEYDQWGLWDVPFRKVSLQEFIEKDENWDVVIMLNSYRNWKGKSRDNFDAWLERNATYFISSGDNHPKEWNYEEIGLDTHGIPLKLFTL